MKMIIDLEKKMELIVAFYLINFSFFALFYEPLLTRAFRLARLGNRIKAISIIITKILQSNIIITINKIFYL